MAQWLAVLQLWLCVANSFALDLYDDFHYPTEEPAERASLQVPHLDDCSTTNSCNLSVDGKSVAVKEGDLVFGGWRVLSILSHRNCVVLEQNFERWGVEVFVSQTEEPVLLRKSVGRLKAIRQPYFNLTGMDNDYWAKVSDSLDDYPSQLAANLTSDGEVDYASLASTLAPQRDIVEISNNADVVKFVVTHNGRVKCASYHENSMNGITDFDDLHAPPPNAQTIVFDPANHTEFWPERFEHSKAGLVGGHLPIANVGSFSPSVGMGFELMAFSPVLNFSQNSEDVSCIFDGPYTDAYVAVCSHGCQKHANLDDAKLACSHTPDCGGITLHKSQYELRASSFTNASTTGEISWLLRNPQDCRHLPRLPTINYNPGVYVRLREESGEDFGFFRYFLADNATLTQVQSSEFYVQLLVHQEFHAKEWNGGMRVVLPDTDRRQVDMANRGLASAWGNYVGNQSNYGNGATYWSVAREDNGSLPLNVLSVEEANLEWGLCNLALPHIGFYLDNYIKADGTVNYYTWGSLGDSVGDVGRIASLYIKATQLCPDAAWTRRYLPVVETLGRHMLSLRSKAKSADLPTPTTGLVIGQPEHDWHRTQDKFFYNNNVWILRGMEELSTFLQEDAARNGTLGKLLETDAMLYRTDIINSVNACLTKDAEGHAHFLPPYAELGMAPFSHMTGGRLAEYSNFRFYSEILLSDVLPKDVESMLLMWHNRMGGRIGGASRFSGWLDDMPTAGWGYGALTNNRTEDFLALLYGHAATYQSRGTFHSTEQLSFRGEGWYRDFLHWPNPNSAKAANLQYYGTENDVSFCIVSQVIVARLTRWQLVFEDFYRPTGTTSPGSIWLARAAPKRWFVPGSQGFSVGNAPTRFGRVSFRMEVTQQGTTYFVTPPMGTPSDLRWKLRWPVPIESVLCQQCTVLEDTDGIVTVVASHPASPFSVTANSSAVSWI